MIKNSLIKIHQLRASLLDWEKRTKLDRYTDHEKIILTLLAKVEKFPISVNKFKTKKFIKDQMSNASFNRAIKDLVKINLIELIQDPKDKRSQLIKKFDIK